MGHHSIEDYVTADNEYFNQGIIYQQRLRSKVLILWIRNLQTTDSKRKFKAFKIAYTFNIKEERGALFFVIIKMICPDIRAE